MRLNKKFVAGTIGAALLFGAPPAFAQSSAQQGYSRPFGVVETQLDNGNRDNSPGEATSTSTPVARTPETVTATKTANKLPFTGLDLVLVVGAGGLLLALGLGMRRMSRSTGLA